jgi:uncharacterized membrane protein
MDTQQLEDLPATTSRVRFLAQFLKLTEPAFVRSMQIAGHSPSADNWQQFLERLFLISGVTLCMVGVMSFFAFNWAALPYYYKLALPQGLMLIALVAAALRGLDNPLSKALLLIASVCAGVGLAMVGQTYQTGADPYSLFVAWAVLILAWVIAARSPGLWLLEIVVINLGFVLYWAQILHPPRWSGFDGSSPVARLFTQLLDFGLAQWLYLLNIIFLTAWEALALRAATWMQGRTLPRILGFLVLGLIMANTLSVIFVDHTHFAARAWLFSPLVYLLATVVGLWLYQFKRRDMFMLAILAFSIVVVISSLVIKLFISAGDMLHWDTGGFLFMFFFIGGTIIGQIYLMARWLRSLRIKWRATQ